MEQYVLADFNNIISFFKYEPTFQSLLSYIRVLTLFVIYKPLVISMVLFILFGTDVSQYFLFT